MKGLETLTRLKILNKTWMILERVFEFTLFGWSNEKWLIWGVNSCLCMSSRFLADFSTQTYKFHRELLRHEVFAVFKFQNPRRHFLSPVRLKNNIKIIKWTYFSQKQVKVNLTYNMDWLTFRVSPNENFELSHHPPVKGNLVPKLEFR